MNNFDVGYDPNPTASQTQISNAERFWLLMANGGEFGVYFGFALSSSLIVRAIPVLIPAGVIAFPAIGVGLLICLATTKDDEAKVRSQFVLLALAVALLAGNWDAWQAWIFANLQVLILSAIAVVSLIVALAALVLSVRSKYE